MYADHKITVPRIRTEIIRAGFFLRCTYRKYFWIVTLKISGKADALKACVERPFFHIVISKCFQDLIRPFKQFVLCGLPGADVFPAGLIDGKLYPVDTVDTFKSIQCGCGITHKLTVVFRCYGDPDSVFVVDDVKQSVRYDHTIAGAESFRYPSEIIMRERQFPVQHRGFPCHQPAY